jgi:hypothetical protein
MKRKTECEELDRAGNSDDPFGILKLFKPASSMDIKCCCPDSLEPRDIVCPVHFKDPRKTKP